MTTMGVYVRDLMLGQYYFDTLLPRIPVPVMRQIVANLEKMKLPTKLSGITGEATRHGSDDTARRPPSVKAALSVSFGQRAPHRASTRDSSPVRRTLPPPPFDKPSSDDQMTRRSQSREYSDREYSDRDRGRDRDRNRDRDSDRDRERYKERERDRDRARDRVRDKERERERDREGSCDYDRRSKYGERERRRDPYESRRDGGRHSRRSRSGSRSRSRSRSGSLQAGTTTHDWSPQRDVTKDRTSASSNLAKLRDLYGDVSDQKGDASMDRIPRGDNGGEEVIRLGGSRWK